jgi:hypothetical protein
VLAAALPVCLPKASHDSSHCLHSHHSSCCSSGCALTGGMWGRAFAFLMVEGSVNPVHVLRAAAGVPPCMCVWGTHAYGMPQQSAVAIGCGCVSGTYMLLPPAAVLPVLCLRWRVDVGGATLP